MTRYEPSPPARATWPRGVRRETRARATRHLGGTTERRARAAIPCDALPEVPTKIPKTSCSSVS
eukprot:16530-Pelagococcus_subviridis.AAC.1